jgi:hypothetical protein
MRLFIRLAQRARKWDLEWFFYQFEPFYVFCLVDVRSMPCLVDFSLSLISFRGKTISIS